MKLTIKDILKLVGIIAPYIVAIGTCAGVYADAKTERAMLEYRLQAVEKDKDDLKADLKSIKDVLYSIDTKLGVYSAILEERTSKKGR